MIVVARAVKVSGHDASVIHTVALSILAVVAFAELDASNLGDCVGLVGGFERVGEQGVFPHRLWSQLGVDAAGTEKEQFLHAIAKGRVDDVSLHHQVLIDEFGWIGVVGVDAAHLRGGQVDLVRLFGGKERADGGLVCQVQLCMGAGDYALDRMAVG